MKNFAKKQFAKVGNCVAEIAKKSTSLTANSACVWFSHQEKLPKEAKKLRKF